MFNFNHKIILDYYRFITEPKIKIKEVGECDKSRIMYNVY